MIYFHRAHQVIVEIVRRVTECEANSVPDEIFGYREAQTNGDRFYIAAQFNRGELPAEVILGDGKIYGCYENTPLEPESRYKVYLRGITKHNGVRLSEKKVIIISIKSNTPELDQLSPHVPVMNV